MCIKFTNIFHKVIFDNCNQELVSYSICMFQHMFCVYKNTLYVWAGSIVALEDQLKYEVTFKPYDSKFSRELVQDFIQEVFPTEYHLFTLIKKKLFFFKT